MQETALNQLASVHSKVVMLYCVIEEEDYTFIVMDYCPDGDLYLFGQILKSDVILAETTSSNMFSSNPSVRSITAALWALPP
jgi:serine/threonine protein kinase